MADFRKQKLDASNPLERNANDISLDFNDLIDPISALIVKNEAMDVYTRRNVFKGVNEYIGLVIQVSTEENYKPPGLFDLVQGSFGEDTRSAYFKAHIPTLHASIGSPCDIGYLNRFGTPNERVSAALKRIQNHPWFYATYTANLFTNRAPSFGDIIKIKFLKNPSSGKMIQGEIVEIISRGNDESLDDLCNQSNKDLFGGYNPNPGNSLLSLLSDITGNIFANNSNTSGAVATGKAENTSFTCGRPKKPRKIESIAECLTKPVSGEIVVGVELTGIVPIVQNEIKEWSVPKVLKSTQNDPKIDQLLTKYWELGLNRKLKRTAAWSGPFMSYVITRVDPTFPTNGFHSGYTAAAANGEGGWTAWSLKTGGKIKAQIGDIFVNSRYGLNTSYESGHGDVVYKIENGKAILAGGNLGSTCKESTTQPAVDFEGYYSGNYGKYLIVLKKNGRIIQAPTN
jgi:hypothetical protein